MKYLITKGLIGNAEIYLRTGKAKDRDDIKTVVRLNIDYLAISFIREAAEIDLVRDLLQQHGSQAGIIAKIERTEAIENIDAIISASDWVIVVSEDLTVEIGNTTVLAVQKHIMYKARSLNKPEITGKQGMDSIIMESIPTRAEVSDVANTVLDSTDAVMLSAEAAIGSHPAQDVVAIHIKGLKIESFKAINNAIHELREDGFVIKGDLVIITSGDTSWETGNTCSMRIVEVGPSLTKIEEK